MLRNASILCNNKSSRLPPCSEGKNVHMCFGYLFLHALFLSLSKYTPLMRPSFPSLSQRISPSWTSQSVKPPNSFTTWPNRVALFKCCIYTGYFCMHSGYSTSKFHQDSWVTSLSIPDPAKLSCSLTIGSQKHHGTKRYPKSQSHGKSALLVRGVHGMTSNLLICVVGAAGGG